MPTTTLDAIQMAAAPREPIRFDHRQAGEEGWNIFTTIRGVEIARDDEAAMFATDADALAFVLAMALEGSRYHAEALAIHIGAVAMVGAEFERQAALPRPAPAFTEPKIVDFHYRVHVYDFQQLAWAAGRSWALSEDPAEWAEYRDEEAADDENRLPLRRLEADIGELMAQLFADAMPCGEYDLDGIQSLTVTAQR